MKRVIACRDGDPCDMDGARDGHCTFGVSMCFGNSDPRYPQCTPTMIQSVEVLSPKAARQGSTLDVFNARQLERVVETLGVEVRRRGKTVAESIAPLGDGLCGPTIQLVTPAPMTAGKKAVRRKVRLRATDVNGRRDTDRFVLVCR